MISHRQGVPFQVLAQKYSYDQSGQHANDNGSENMIIRGDNLEALKALLPRHEVRVKRVYIDPPYSTGNGGWMHSNSVSDPKIKKWLGAVVGKEGETLPRRLPPALAGVCFESCREIPSPVLHHRPCCPQHEQGGRRKQKVHPD